MTQTLSREEILGILRELRQEINRQETILNLTADEDLIDAVIYNLKSLNCRYNHYLKLAKATA